MSVVSLVGVLHVLSMHHYLSLVSQWPLAPIYVSMSAVVLVWAEHILNARATNIQYIYV